MIRADGFASSIGPAFKAASTAAELRQDGVSRGERFSDFSAFDAGVPGQVGMGRDRASIDAVHAARTVASFLLDAG